MKRWLKLDQNAVDKALEIDDDTMTTKATICSEDGSTTEVELTLSLSDDGLEVGWEE